MPAAVASRARPQGKQARAGSDALPPAKKTKLSQPAPAPAPAPRQNGYAALLGGAPSKKPAVAAKPNGARNARKHAVDEATAVVGRGAAGPADVDMADAAREVIEITSGEEESDYSSSGDEHARAGAEGEAAADTAAPIANGHIAEAEHRPVEDGTAEPEELSFGERLRAHDPEPTHAPHVVDVEAAFADADAGSRALAAASISRPLAAPSAASLGTVLTQALRTNDKDLLDSCLRVMDPDTVYTTVERLPSPLVGNLLQKLAERLHKRPGRAGIFMVWVQWSLAAHGGYLASQPQLVKQLAALNRVLKERASGLQPLLSLKGRLDMLQAQLELRKRNQRRAVHDDEDEAVIYVEGEDEISSADEDDQSIGGSDTQPGSMPKGIQQASHDDDDESSVDEMPTTMEVYEGSEEGSEDSEDLLDDEAEETDNDTGDDMSEPMSGDDFDNADDVSESGEDSRPARRSTVGRAGLARRH